jgi:YVTN family beta-propeller protein
MKGRAYGLVVSSDGSRLFVPDFDTRSLSILDTASGQIVRDVPAGPQPFDAAMSPVSGEILVPNQRDGTISVIDGTSLDVTQTVSIGARIGGIAFGPDGRAYVATSNGIASLVPPHYARGVAIPLSVGPGAIAIGSRHANGCFPPQE